MRKWQIATALLSLGGLSAGSGSAAHAQRLVDWPVRVSVGAEASISGAGAVFWNPAALRREELLVDALLVDVRTPGDLGVRSLGAAATYSVQRTTFGVGYRHASVDGIPLTEGPPVTGTPTEISVGEDEFILAATQALNPGISIGATARYLRTAFSDVDENGLAIGAGVDLHPALPWKLQLSGFAFSESDGLAWGVGAEVEVPRWLGADYAFRASYGARGNDREPAMLHRVAGMLEWRNRATIGAALVREPDVENASWQPALAASLRLSRYTVGIVREQLPNDFGATYALRLQFGLGRERDRSRSDN